MAIGGASFNLPSLSALVPGVDNMNAGLSKDASP